MYLIWPLIILFYFKNEPNIRNFCGSLFSCETLYLLYKKLKLDAWFLRNVRSIPYWSLFKEIGKFLFVGKLRGKLRFSHFTFNHHLSMPWLLITNFQMNYHSSVLMCLYPFFSNNPNGLARVVRYFHPSDKPVIAWHLRAIWKYFSRSFGFLDIALAYGSCNIKETKRTRKIFHILHSVPCDN